jgi:hypothetical protein
MLPFFRFEFQLVLRFFFVNSWLGILGFARFALTTKIERDFLGEDSFSVNDERVLNNACWGRSWWAKNVCLVCYREMDINWHCLVFAVNGSL